MDKTVPRPAAFLLDFIGSKEAPKGYDTVYANRMDRMPKPLTRMTMKEVLDQGKWRTKTFGSSACGRYQFMDATLRGLASELDLQAGDVFTPDYQDRLGLYLLRRRGYEKWITGRMSDHAFMIQLAQEWASFPVPYRMQGQKKVVERGQSYYAGDGLNKSLISAEAVEAALTKAKGLAGAAPLPPSRPTSGSPSPAVLAAMGALIAAVVAVAALLGIDASAL